MVCRRILDLREIQFELRADLAMEHELEKRDRRRKLDMGCGKKRPKKRKK